MKMPLYDCVLLLKPHVKQESLMQLVAKVGKHVCRRNGVVTDMKSFGTVQLGYGIKKLDGKYFQGRLLQMTMMTPPSFNSELHYLNKEDRLLRWLLVKHRDAKLGVDFFDEIDPDGEFESFRTGLVMEAETDEESSDEGVEYEDEDVDEYDA